MARTAQTARTVSAPARTSRAAGAMPRAPFLSKASASKQEAPLLQSLLEQQVPLLSEPLEQQVPCFFHPAPLLSKPLEQQVPLLSEPSASDLRLRRKLLPRN